MIHLDAATATLLAAIIGAGGAITSKAIDLIILKLRKVPVDPTELRAYLVSRIDELTSEQRQLKRTLAKLQIALMGCERARARLQAENANLKLENEHLSKREAVR